jgi:hypothetical protein
MMVCSTCGAAVQRHAGTCVNVGCAAHQQPIVVLERPPVAPVAPPVAIRPLRTLATTVSVAVLISGVLTAAGVEFGTNADPGRPNSVWAAAELLGGAAGLVGFVVFVVWLYRARRNVELWPDWEPNWSKGWTIAAWLIPIANIYLPSLVVSEVARLSVPPDREGRRSRLGMLSRIWWVGWVVLLLTRARLLDDTVTHGTPIVVITVLLQLAVAVGTVLLVRAVTAEQERRATA